MASKKKVVFYLILLAIIVLAAFFLYRNRVKIGKIFTPFLMAVAIAYLLNPMVIRLERRRIPRSISILLLYLLIFAAVGAATFFLVPELVKNIKELTGTLPEITSDYRNLFNNIVNTIRTSDWSEDIKKALFNEIQNSTFIIQSYVSDALKKTLAAFMAAVSAFFDLLLAMIIAYYFIKDAGFFKQTALSLVPRRWRNGIIGAGREINLILSNFVQGQLLTALIVGILESAGLSLFGIKYSLVLGMIGGAANVIPYFGPIIGAVPAVAVSLIESPLKALKAALVFAAVQQADNSFISPKIIEGRLGLHPVTTILAVMAGGEFFGIPGMLLSVPAAAIIKVIVRRAIDAIV